MKWEYKYEDFGDNIDASVITNMNKLGEKGWELIGFTNVSEIFSDGKNCNQYQMIFKRPIK